MTTMVAQGGRVIAPMVLIRQPNRWSCNGCAWAMVLGLTLQEIVAALGHDGQATDGFEDDELVWLAAQRGYASSFLFPTGAGEQAPCPLTDEAMMTFLRGRRAVLHVTHPRLLEPQEIVHAVAWDGARVFDPLLGETPLTEYTLHGAQWIVRALEPAV